MNKKQCVAMLLAGGQGSRLAPLTNKMAKPAVPFGSKYRIIDFSLSNCVNSGIDTVGVLTQYQPLQLNDYLGRGQSWDLNLTFGGLHILPPYQAKKGGDWFKGTANAIYQNLNFIEAYDPEYVLILSGDHIYKMDYSIMLEEHIKNKADCTIAVIDVPKEEASRFGIMNTGEGGRILEFEEKPEHPKSTQASMGVYIFSTDKLKKYLRADENNPDSENDFGKNVIPAMLNDECRMFAYLYRGYWRDVGTLGSFWSANMDTLGDLPPLYLNDPGWRIYYHHQVSSPQYLGKKALVINSVVGEGCDIEGTVKNSVIFSNVKIKEGAVIKDSIVMNDSVIGKNTSIDYSIIDNDVDIKSGVKIGGPKKTGKLTVLAGGIKIRSDMKIPAGTIVEKDMK